MKRMALQDGVIKAGETFAGPLVQARMVPIATSRVLSDGVDVDEVGVVRCSHLLLLPLDLLSSLRQGHWCSYARCFPTLT